MEKPTITINGKTYELPRPKCGVWRKLVTFEDEHGNFFVPDSIEKRCEFLAEIYGGVFSATDLLDNLFLDEIAQCYRDCVNFIISTVAGKYEKIEKNVDAGDKMTP